MKPREGLAKGNTYLQDYVDAKLEAVSEIFKQMPFEERKEKLVKSEAWNCWINQHNTHLKPEEITENNIDKEIENVGRRWGMDIEKQYNTMSWIHLAMNGAICKVYIP